MGSGRSRCPWPWSAITRGRVVVDTALLPGIILAEIVRIRSSPVECRVPHVAGASPNSPAVMCARTRRRVWPLERQRVCYMADGGSFVRWFW